jgi:(2Fe-2S) ferredoxin
MSGKKRDESLVEAAKRLGVNTAERHMLLCAGPKCCEEERGMEIWTFLKGRLRELGLSEKSIYRTKVHCLRICQQGPIAVVYPEGTWYHSLDQQRCEAIIQQHLIGGKPVSEYTFATNPL